MGRRTFLGMRKRAPRSKSASKTPQKPKTPNKDVRVKRVLDDNENEGLEELEGEEIEEVEGEEGEEGEEGVEGEGEGEGDEEEGGDEEGSHQPSKKKQKNTTVAQKEKEDKSKDSEIRKYIDQRINSFEHVYIKRLTRALHVGYCRAQRILGEYLAAGKVTKTTGQGYSNVLPKPDSQGEEIQAEEEEEVEEEGEEEVEEGEVEEVEEEEGEGEDEGGEEEEGEEDENQTTPQRNKRKRDSLFKKEVRGTYVNKLRRNSRNGKPNGNLNLTQISFLHSREYLKEHAAKSAATFEETKAMLQATPTTELKRYQSMGRALVLKCSQNPLLTHPPHALTNNHIHSHPLPHTPKHELKLTEQKHKQSSSRVPPSPPPAHSNHPKPSRPFR